MPNAQSYGAFVNRTEKQEVVSLSGATTYPTSKNQNETKTETKQVSAEERKSQILYWFTKYVWFDVSHHLVRFGCLLLTKLLQLRADVLLWWGHHPESAVKVPAGCKYGHVKMLHSATHKNSYL